MQNYVYKKEKDEYDNICGYSFSGKFTYELYNHFCIRSDIKIANKNKKVFLGKQHWKRVCDNKLHVDDGKFSQHTAQNNLINFDSTYSI